MLVEQTTDKLYQMKLNAMATALREQMQNPEYAPQRHHNRSDWRG